MNRLLRLLILVVSVIIAIVIVGLAYFSNYESILEKPSIYLILFLLFINIVANIFQIADGLEKYLEKQRKKPEKKLAEIFYKASRDPENPYSDPSLNKNEETSED